MSVIEQERVVIIKTWEIGHSAALAAWHEKHNRT